MQKVSIAGIAINGEGKLFIARRNAGGDLGGKWEFPGGKVEVGESDVEALKREYREELGVAIEAGPLLASTEFTHNEKKYTLNAYRIFFASDNFTLTEHSEWRWASPDEIAQLDFADSDRRLLLNLSHFIGTSSPVGGSGSEG